MDWVNNLKLSKVQRPERLYNTRTSQQELDQILSKQYTEPNEQIKKTSKWYNLEQISASKTIAEQIHLETTMKMLEYMDEQEWQKELQRLDETDALIKSFNSQQQKQEEKQVIEEQNEQAKEVKQETPEEQEKQLNKEINQLQDELSVSRRASEILKQEQQKIDNQQMYNSVSSQNNVMSMDDTIEQLAQKSQQLINSINNHGMNSTQVNDDELALWIDDKLYLQYKGIQYYTEINKENISFTDSKIIIKAKDINDNCKIIYINKDNEELIEKLSNLL